MTTTWHISITFQAPRGAVITDDAIDSIHKGRPEFNTVSRMLDNQLEFTVDADSNSSTDLYAAVYRRAAKASTDVLGFPVEFLHGEVIRYDHWLEQIDPNGEILNWANQTKDTDEVECGACADTISKVSVVAAGWKLVRDTHYDADVGQAILVHEWQCASCAPGAHSENAPGNGTSGGVKLTDETIERLADEAEQGYPTEQLRKRRRSEAPGEKA